MMATALALLFRDGPGEALDIASRLAENCGDRPEALEVLSIARMAALNGATAERAAILASHLGFFFLADRCATLMHDAERENRADRAEWRRATWQLGFVTRGIEDAERAYQAMDWGRALEIYSGLWEHNVDLPVVWQRRVGCSFRLGDLDQTLAMCHEMAQREAHNPELSVMWAQVLSARGELDVALEMLQSCDHPRNRQMAAWREISCWIILGNPAKARSALDKIPAPHIRTLQSGVLAVATGDLDAASAILAPLDNTAEVTLLLGIIAEMRGRWFEAADRYQVTIDSVPLSCWPLVNLAGLEKKRGNHRAAQAILTQASACHAGDLAFLQRLRSVLFDRV